MSARTDRRRTPQALSWLAAGIAAVVLSSCLALTVWTWLQEDDMKTLRAGLEAQQQARSTSEARLAALQGTATALEGRLAALEGGIQQGEPASADPSTESADPLQRIEDLEAAMAELQVAAMAELQVAAMAELQVEVGDLRVGLNDAISKIEGRAPTAEELAQTTPDTARLSVARQQQSHNLSCESSAASMVAQYHGVQLSEEEVLASLPFNSNPHLGFRGNVDGPTGGIVDYGVYAEPISGILNARGLQARMIAGGMEGIEAAVARGNPVIAWVTYNCQPSTPTTTQIDGQEVTLVPNQHVVVVTGFNAEGVWANDPWDGQEDYYRIDDFERAISYFGNMAIEIARP